MSVIDLHHPPAGSVSSQQTIAAPVSCDGIGVHSGAPVHLRLLPAAIDTGIVFYRTDVSDAHAVVPANWQRVARTTLCTEIRNAHGVSVSTIEHLMAALVAGGIDNVRVELNGSEVPIMDGSAAPFALMIDMAGTAPQAAARRHLEIRKTVRVERDGAFAELRPQAFASFHVAVAYPGTAIPEQRYDWRLSAAGFRREIASARTFGFAKEIEALRAAGHGRGASLTNAIAVGETGVMNPEGLRFADEFARHKLLDAVGDLALAGAPIHGAFHGYKSGHALNHQLLCALFADKTAYAWCRDEGAASASAPVAARAIA